MHRVVDRWLSILPLLVALLLAAPVAGAAQAPAAEIEHNGRVVAFADVHGAFPELRQLLQQSGMIDATGNWSGGSTRLVSLGDVLDRGAESRRVLDLLMHLQPQAAAAGGGVHLVLGNHETMVMGGDLRYVSAAEYAAFAGEETEAERQQLLDAYTEALAGSEPAAIASAFARDYPPGRIALERAFAPSGRYGAWLVAQPFVLKINDTVFMHGGASHVLVELGTLAEVNRRLAQDLRTHLELITELRSAGALPITVRSPAAPAWLAQQLETVQDAAEPAWAGAAKRLIELEQSPVLADNGPLWYRGTARCHPCVTAFDTERLLAAWGARRIVLGHTPTDSHRVVSRLDGSVILADTGMLGAVYKGRASAVVIDRGTLAVQYPGEPGLVAPEPEQLRVPRQPPDMDDATLENFLLNAAIVDDQPVGTGITKPRKLTLEMDGRRLDAIYKPHDTSKGLQARKRYTKRDDQSDRYIYEVAAYKLDRALGIERVPVAVERVVGGKPGLVQLWVSGTINERDRTERGVAFGGMCPQWDQYRLRILWDILVYNEDRNLTNLLWTDDDFTLLLIDHSLAFRSSHRRPEQYAKVRVDLPEWLRGRLQRLDEGRLTTLLGAYLHPVQIKALLARRDLLLREARPTGFRY